MSNTSDRPLRQYKILYTRTVSSRWAALKPGRDMKLYGRQEIVAAIDHMREHPEIEGIAIRLGSEMYNILAFIQPAHAADAFLFDDES